MPGPAKTIRETMEKLLDIDDVSEMLGVTKATIYSWTSQNKIPHVKLSKRLLKFRATEIMAWIAARSFSMDTCTPPERIENLKTDLNGSDDFIERIINTAKKEALN